MKIIDYIKKVFRRKPKPMYIITIKDATQKEINRFREHLKTSKDEFIITNSNIEIVKIR